MWNIKTDGKYNTIQKNDKCIMVVVLSYISNASLRLYLQYSTSFKIFTMSIIPIHKYSM